MEDAVQPACGLATVFNQSTVLGCSQAQEKQILHELTERDVDQYLNICVFLSVQYRKEKKVISMKDSHWESRKSWLKTAYLIWNLLRKKVFPVFGWIQILCYVSLELLLCDTVMSN